MNIKNDVLWEKKGVQVQPACIMALALIAPIMESTGEYTITALLDGEHMPTSLHYVGLAADIRTHHMDEATKESVAAELKKLLGSDYDFEVEGDHYHLETSDLWLAKNGDPRKAS